MKLTESISSAVERLLAARRPFAVYALPGSGPQMAEAAEFVLCPWATSASGALTIASEGVAEAPETCSTPHEYYETVVSQVRDAHRAAGGGKTVISRIICGRAGRSFSQAAEELFEAFPDTLRYVCWSPATGGWMGATPEILAEISGRGLRTMALAGTKATDGSLWDRKNIEEQAMVADFITDTLRRFSSRVEQSERHTLRYGEIEHLCTDIHAQLRPDADSEAVIDALNPTPAVCGTPREAAMARIGSLERHARRFYAGYISVPGAGGSRSYFVNLRCANFDPATGQVCIYAGGGITALSNPAAEWEETARKASKLIELLGI